MNNEEIYKQLDMLPTAELKEIQTKEGTNLQKHRAVMSNGECIAVLSDKYILKQHKEAFTPLIAGLEEAGMIDSIGLHVSHNNKSARINFLVEQGYDTVNYGFWASNSYDGQHALRFSFTSFTKSKYIEVVGYRQVCKNGMVMRVPMNQAEFVKVEEREKIKELLKEQNKIIHKFGMEDKMISMQNAVKAMTLLKEPIERMIRFAEGRSLPEEYFDVLLKKYFKKKLKSVIRNRYASEPQTLWGFYNAITYVASHDVMAESSRTGLQNRASRMLYEEMGG
jgi:hypothetical protein